MQPQAQQPLFPTKPTYNYKGDIHFTQNWNGKLFNKYLTTIRLYKPSFYHANGVYRLLLNDNLIADGKIIDIRYCTIQELPEWTCYLDTGYSKRDTINMFKTMYKKQELNWDTQMLSILLIENLDFITTTFKKKDAAINTH